jgi:PAS domain S-box-containing protein
MGITYIVKYKNIALLSSILLFVIGGMVIFGWFAEIEVLKSIYPNFVSMKFNTAICFILLGLALYIELKDGLGRFYFIPKIMAAITGLFGLISFVQLFGFNFAIDELFISDTGAFIKGEYNPGRMSPLTAFCFVCAGLAVLLTKSEQKNNIKLYQLLLHAITLVSAIAILGYLFSLPRLYNYSFANSMALHSSLLFIIFSVSASLLHPNSGITGLFTGKEIGNVMARRLFIWIIPTVIVVGYISNVFTATATMPEELAIALVSIAFILLCLICIWITSKALNKIAHKEQQLQENFRITVDAAPYALILSKPDGEIIHLNYKAERLFGYTREELIGKNTSLVIPEDLRKDAAARTAHFFSNERTVRYTLDDEIYCCSKKGRRFPCEVILAPVKTSEGMMALASVIDATDRKHSEEIMQTQLRELQQKSQEMEQFSFIASHDLQEPLRTVSNYIMLLEEDYPEQVKGEVKEHLSAISDAAARMKKLISTLLDFGRLGRDKTLAYTDIKIVLSDVVADLKSLLDENKAIVNYNPDDLPTLYAYETELRMLFQNLLNNAVKFCKRDTLPQIKISCRAIDGYYEFAVADNGIGMDEKHLNDIFNIFQRLHTADEYEGHGIGLAHCKKIAEMHGGKIWVESIPGEGSTFKFTILNLKL